ncbi:hypothetical protein [Oryzihumus leptocrescens]|nr:hypothetical protein [Oryzihumus leptocrescens]
MLAATVVALAGCGTTATSVSASQLASSTRPAPAACPATTPPDRSGADTSDGSVMVPGHPATVLVCPYPGYNPPAPGSPAPKSARTDGAALARLVNALPEPPGGTMNCGADTGERDVLYFVYAATGRALQVVVERTGCHGVASAFGRRWSPPGDPAAMRLTDRLRALTGA